MTYELLYIVGSQYADNEIAGVMEKIGGMLAKAGAAVARNENLGKIKLAYPIKNARHGTYVLVHFEAEPAAVNALDRSLRLSDEVLRHQIVTLPKGAEKRTYQISAYVAPLSEEARRELPAAPRPRPVAPAQPPTKREEASMSIADLDKKLDEILETDVTKGA